MKRIGSILLLLVFTLFLASCSATPADLSVLALAQRNESTDAYASVEGVRVAFSLNAPLAGLEFQCRATDSQAAVTVKIYAADTDHDTTLAADPVREMTFRNPAAKMLWQFDSLPAGDYLIAFSDSAGVELLKSAAPSAEAAGKILHYRNGSVMTEGILVLTLLCEKTESVPQPSFITFTYPVIVE